jgi:hypothetical protein
MCDVFSSRWFLACSDKRAGDKFAITVIISKSTRACDLFLFGAINVDCAAVVVAGVRIRPRSEVRHCDGVNGTIFLVEASIRRQEFNCNR